MKLQAAYGPLQFDLKNHQVHPTAQLNWKTPHDSLLIFWMNLFFLPPQNIILSGGNNFCKSVVVKPHHPYVFGLFRDRKVGGSDDSSYPNLTTASGAYVFLQIELVETQPPRICWAAMSRSHKELNLKTQITEVLQSPYLKLGLLADGGRPTPWEETTCFFSDVFLKWRAPIVKHNMFVKFLEKLGGIWTWLPIKINTMFFGHLYWHVI